MRVRRSGVFGRMGGLASDAAACGLMRRWRGRRLLLLLTDTTVRELQCCGSCCSDLLSRVRLRGLGSGERESVPLRRELRTARVSGRRLELLLRLGRRRLMLLLRCL